MTEVVGLAGLLVAFASLTLGQVPSDTQASSGRLLEIRSYNLTAGTRERFHELFVRESLPLLRRWNVDVVAYGPSLHDKDSYFLMRAFSSSDERDRIEKAFYDSPEWRNGPRAAVLAAIESYTTIVVHVDDDTLRRLRRGVANKNASGVDRLPRLNADDIDAVTSNVRRFTAIRADDFRMQMSDRRYRSELRLSCAEHGAALASPLHRVDHLGVR